MQRQELWRNTEPEVSDTEQQRLETFLLFRELTQESRKRPSHTTNNFKAFELLPLPQEQTQQHLALLEVWHPGLPGLLRESDHLGGQEGLRSSREPRAPLSLCISIPQGGSQPSSPWASSPSNPDLTRPQQFGVWLFPGSCHMTLRSTRTAGTDVGRCVKAWLAW